MRASTPRCVTLAINQSATPPDLTEGHACACEFKLPAQAAACFKQNGAMAAQRRNPCRFHSRRSTTTDDDVFDRFCRRNRRPQRSVSLPRIFRLYACGQDCQRAQHICGHRQRQACRTWAFQVRVCVKNGQIGAQSQAVTLPCNRLKIDEKCRLTKAPGSQLLR